MMIYNFLTRMGNSGEKSGVQAGEMGPGQAIPAKESNQKHIKGGEYIKSAVYGGLDGIITTLIIALSGIGSNVSPSTIVALGFSSLITDGFSMALADYLATKSDAEYMKAEEIREKGEIEADFQAQKQEMREIYVEMGLKSEVSEEIVSILSKNKEGFLSVMMIEQLQLIPDEENPFTNGLVTFFSFALFGLMPLIPFFVAKANDLPLQTSLTVSTILITFGFLVVLGVGKSCVTIQAWYWSALETVVIGTISAASSFGIGKAFGQ